ncbi:HAMP domain-containing histidine kinase [Aurantibacter crassamenti]|uniref:sensor histidine kinase n=1 Tax=Aurantibacter crassamenti TaxID=1837375 RepID=UPI001939309B|nr:HAMP domain-containing sensor histidine kinase [Aurantibacter crassamenti]MBM1105455.1 HAMP domain-containing histidine kinase [Aurantibacter crassamenti]
MILFNKFRKLVIGFLLFGFCSVTAQKQSSTNKELDSIMKLAFDKVVSHNYFESFKLAERVKELALESNEIYYLALAEDLISGAHTDMYNYSTAISYQLKSIEHSTLIKDLSLLTVGYSNLAHRYMLLDDFDNSNESIKKVEELDDKNLYNTRLYVYETKVMSLYKQRMFDSLVTVAKAGLKQLEFEKNKRLADPNFIPNDWRELMDERLLVTFELYLAYGLFETNKVVSHANSLLNKHKNKKLEEILYASVRIYENYHRIFAYKEQYFLNLPIKNFDSIQYYKIKQEEYFTNAVDYLKKSSQYKTDYLTQAIESENQVERLKLITENRVNEIQFNRRVSYLFGFLTLLALSFVVFYKRAISQIKKSNASLDQADVDLKKLYLNCDRFLAVVSNEIRTPLYTLEQLIATVPINDNEIEDELILANYSLMNLRHSINNSLQYSKLNYFNDNDELINRPVNLKDLLDGLNMNFKSMLIANQVQLKVNYNGDNNIFDFERAKVALVLNNLVKNAIEKDDVTQVEVNVSERYLGRSRSLLTFCVEDDESIISQDDLTYVERGKLVFEDKNTTKGVRLGLILSNQLLALYGSKLKFSGDQEHNIVSFELKLAISNKKKIASNKSSSKKSNILYVDDNQLN